MDRVAVISDIHGNIPALEAVLSDIKSRGISRIICLGDLAGKGPSSDTVVDMIRENCEAVVKGNWDYLISEVYDSDVLLWHRKKLGDERIKYLIDLPLYTELNVSGRTIRLCHADPKDVFHRVRLTSTIEEKLTLFIDPKEENKESDVLGYGDIHRGYIENIKDKTLFNVGSVGNPLDLTQASYGIIEGECDTNENSSFSITLVRVPYDIEEAVQQAIDSGMPDLEEYINELRTGIYRGIKK